MFSDIVSLDQDIGSLDVSTASVMSNAFSASGLSVQNYEAILGKWALLTLQPNVYFGAQGINYCNAAQARQSIIDNYGWTISDANLDCSYWGLEGLSDAFELYPNPTNDYINAEGVSE